MREVLRVYRSPFEGGWAGTITRDGVEIAGIVGCESEQAVIDTAYDLRPCSDFEIEVSE